VQSSRSTGRVARRRALTESGVIAGEDLGPQKVVDLILARGVTAHQALHGRRLVRREMIDVQIGMLSKPIHDEVDESFKRAPPVYCTSRLIS